MSRDLDAEMLFRQLTAAMGTSSDVGVSLSLGRAEDLTIAMGYRTSVRYFHYCYSFGRTGSIYGENNTGNPEAFASPCRRLRDETRRNKPSIAEPDKTDKSSGLTSIAMSITHSSSDMKVGERKSKLRVSCLEIRAVLLTGYCVTTLLQHLSCNNNLYASHSLSRVLDIHRTIFKLTSS